MLNVALANFNGPLDLLLEMAREHRFDLYDLDIRLVADQYGEYVHQNAATRPLDETAGYLVMAAYLYDLKVRFLLPAPEEQFEDSSADLERDRLVVRLIEYEKYKSLTPTLEELINARLAMFDKSYTDEEQYSTKGQVGPLPEHLPVERLFETMKKIIARLQERTPVEHRVIVKELSADHLKAEVLDFVKGQPGQKATLTGFMESVDEIRLSTQFFATAFIAVLDLTRQQELAIAQDEHYGEIVMSYVPESERRAW